MATKQDAFYIESVSPTSRVTEWGNYGRCRAVLPRGVEVFCRAGSQVTQATTGQCLVYVRSRFV